MAESADRLIPARPTLPRLRKAAAGCRACPLWESATQTVFGEGPAPAAALFVGEQPGDHEDTEGRPFVGPAGRLFDEWVARGTRRIHAKPTWTEVQACRPWLEAELAVVQPKVLVCLGATAAQSLLGKQFRVTKDRGRWLESDLAPHVMATIHPSAILRQRDKESRQEELAALVKDLKLAATAL